MNGAVEQATVYDTKDEAEAGAFLAASLDPELAGRVYVMEKDKAFERDKAQIAKRKKIMEDEEQFKNMRFKLGKGDGGSP